MYHFLLQYQYWLLSPYMVIKYFFILGIRFGASGVLKRFDASCQLPVSSLLLDKVFLAWWYWLVALAAVGLARLVWRVVEVKAM